MIRAIIVDDMPKARKMLQRYLAVMEDVEILTDTGTAVEAIEFVKEHEVDLVFMDIEMPEMSGIEAAKILETLQHAPDIIFLTAYSDYAIDAWKTDAIYYIVKPFMADDVENAVYKYKKKHNLLHKNQNKIKIMCFPVFNVFVNGTPIYFKNKKAKEVMAYLVHYKGGWVENADVCYAVLEEIDEEKAKNNLRTYVNRLKTTLEEAGVTDIIEHSYGKLRINPEMFECDYYQYLEGNSLLFQGEYLKEYSWAEPALAAMYNNKK